MESSTSPSRVQPVAELAEEAVVVVEAARQRLLLAAHLQLRTQLQVERLLFRLALQRPQAEDVVAPVVAEDAAQPRQRVRSRLKPAC
jgi:hypothetical protein